MTNFGKLSIKRTEMLGLSNKGMILSLDKLSIHLTTAKYKKAKDEIKILKGQLENLEKMIAEAEIMEAE